MAMSHADKRIRNAINMKAMTDRRGAAKRCKLCNEQPVDKFVRCFTCRIRCNAYAAATRARAKAKL